MKRRDAIALGGMLLTCPALVLPQTKPAARRRIGTLSSAQMMPSGKCEPNWRGQHFRDALKEFGQVEELHYVLVVRCSDGRPERLPDLARQLVAAKVDVIVAWGNEPIRVMKTVADRIPIVMVYGPDPVAAGWARSLNRPGGNLTGMTWETELGASFGLKIYELITETMPGVRRIVQLEWADTPLRKPYDQMREQASSRLGVDIFRVGISSAEGIEEAFRRVRAVRAEALLIAPDNIWSLRKAIMGHVVAEGLPAAIWAGSEETVAGFPDALLCYATHTDDQPRRAARFVDRILKGANPGDLPIERPVKTNLVVNLRVARKLGIKIPQSVLVRADRVIE